jgi:aspartyl/glutamyl-tRNA(Asn/Gln) amidotransferase C subunit
MIEEEISLEVFEHLAQLAALQLGPDETLYLHQQLNNQLRVIRELAAIPLEEDLPSTAHGVLFTPEISPEPRPDIWEPCADVTDILAQVPRLRDGYIVVPGIPHTTLE